MSDGNGAVVIEGCGTALVTPFDDNGNLDMGAFRELVEWQVESGVDFLVPCGTTGESVTLGDNEYRQVVRTCVQAAEGQVPVVAGAGSNNTPESILLAKTAEEEGADAIMSVTPYYNKPTQGGLRLHFQVVAEAVEIPMILYNVPGRTACNLEPDTVKALASHQRILGVKEASGNFDQIMRIADSRPEGFRLLSGDDALTLCILAAGGDGVVSVVSNAFPAEMTRMVKLARDSKFRKARQIHYRLLNLMRLNFIETSPAPIKYVLSRLGRGSDRLRLPLVPLSEENRALIDAELDRLGS